MNLPAVDDLIGAQWTVYDSPVDKSLFIVGPPGSGKTTLAVLRARFLAGPDHRQKVCLVTKNRMLAVLARQLGDSTFATTTMNKLVSRDYRHRFSTNVPGFSTFTYEWETIVADYERIGAGHLFDHLVIDEGQNLPPGFFAWAHKVGARTLTIFADEDQSTDTQRSSLKEICAATGIGDPLRLPDNHRNTPEIAAVAEHFHHSMTLPPAVVQRPASGEVPRLVRLNSLDDLPRRVATRYKNRGDAIGLIVHRKAEALSIHSALKKVLPGERVDVYTSDLEKNLEEAIHLLDRGVTILTGEAVIGLEFNSVFLLDLNRSLPCRDTDAKRRLYMLCARARDVLTLIDFPPHLTPSQLVDLPSPPVLVR
ncbi:ATP-binding protein [Corallococcus sp. AB049A]|uniref:ATP-binding protein n=1 Tax=Corallococcus sp. AB049A TaxID=2316721 RepID=UPI0011C3862A|nr:ATP-binding protein [Corallococcus sp. AB049A]